MPARRKQSEGHTPEERTRADLRVVPPFPKVEHPYYDPRKKPWARRLLKQDWFWAMLLGLVVGGLLSLVTSVR